MKIALAQINPTVGDFVGNTRKIVEFAERAQLLGADLVMFPELAVCGYWPADLLEKKSFILQAEEALKQVCEWTAEPGRPSVLCGGVLPMEEIPEGKRVRNVAVLMEHGVMKAVQQKMLLPFYDVFDEQRYFEPAAAQRLMHVVTSSGDVPVAITICEDAWNDKDFWPRRWYRVDPIERLMQEWGDIKYGTPRVILNISASPYWQGKREVRQEMLGALARRHGAYVAMTNQVGGNDSLIFDGSSLAVAPDGSIIAQAASFAEDLVVFDTEPVSEPPASSLPEPPEEVKATWDALVLGTRDYVRKCGFSKALIGLSGGIDSAPVSYTHLTLPMIYSV